MGAHSRTVEGGVTLVEAAVDPKSPHDDDMMSAVEATYSSLIQQYLSVFCVDNATFLAERLVATCKTNHAYYLLALCHYRAGSPQRARCVLQQGKEPTPAMQYLLAKCCTDMKEYGPAEEALLHDCRAKFRQARTEDDKLDMDEWILSTTVRNYVVVVCARARAAIMLECASAHLSFLFDCSHVQYRMERQG